MVPTGGGTLADELAISKLLHRLCQHMDRNESDEWLGCFTDDGGWTYLTEDDEPPVFELKGQEELRRFIERQAMKNAALDLKHIVANSVIDVEGDRARSTTYYFTHARTLEGTPKLRTSGRYEDEFLRGHDGRWRLQQRVVKLDMGPRPTA